MKKAKKRAAAGKKRGARKKAGAAPFKKRKKNILLYMAAGAAVLAALSAAVIWAGAGMKSKKDLPAKTPFHEGLPEPVSGTAETGVPVKKKLAGMKEEVKLTFEFDEVIGGESGLYTLRVCCPGGYERNYYTAKMPLEYVLYEFEPEVPTVTVFGFDNREKTGMFEIIILDKMIPEESVKAISVAVFIQELKKFMPGYVWKGNVRKEIN